MKDLFIEKTNSTPLISFDAMKGILRIEGRSIPENPDAFYEPLLDWIQEYFGNPLEMTLVILKLEYVNSGTSKYLMEMLRLLNDHYDKGMDLVVNWYYEEEDESIYELGYHYKDSVDLPFRLNIIYE